MATATPWKTNDWFVSEWNYAPEVTKDFKFAKLKDMIFDVPTFIETVSAYLTLEPGDLLATGTPAGVGIGFDPPRYLQPGDIVRISISGIGELTNPVV